MRLTIAQSARDLGVDKMHVLLCRGLRRAPDCDALNAAVAELERQVRTSEPLSTAFEHGFSALFTRMGYPAMVPAGTKLKERVRGLGFKRISGIVDAYNIVASRHGYGIGAHDATRLLASQAPELIVRRAVGGDTIVPLSSDRCRNIPAGDLIYTLDGRNVAWLGRRDVDADEFKISAQTSVVFFVLIGLDAIPARLLRQVSDELRDIVCRVFPGSAATGFDA
jgi:DNA/RNA-binding domain of Phe-tRNA-synthetase-like protein